jgi:hypothetical protein
MDVQIIIVTVVIVVVHDYFFLSFGGCYQWCYIIIFVIQVIVVVVMVLDYGSVDMYWDQCHKRWRDNRSNCMYWLIFPWHICYHVLATTTTAGAGTSSITTPLGTKE